MTEQPASGINTETRELRFRCFELAEKMGGWQKEAQEIYDFVIGKANPNFQEK